MLSLWKSPQQEYSAFCFLRILGLTYYVNSAPPPQFNYYLFYNYNNHKYILLGDMLELGKKSKELHEKLSTVINHSNINKIFIHGNLIMDTYKNVNKDKRGNVLQDKSDFKDILLPILQNNDYLMIKGSNATGLNKISKNLSRGKINAI